MLEKNFSNGGLDDDFITLWSRYILGCEAEEIIEPLRQLAEQGQINAIQSWYLIKKPEDINETINRIVGGFYGDSFNEAWAVANRYYDRDRGVITDLQNRIQWAVKNGNEFLMNRLKNQLDATDYARMIGLTAELVEATAQSTRDALVYERLVELYASEPVILEKYYVGEDGFKALRPALERKVNGCPDNASYKFALGKNYFFGSMFGENENVRRRGVRILTELAQRPLVCCSEMARGAESDSLDEFGSTENSVGSYVLDGQMRLF